MIKNLTVQEIETAWALQAGSVKLQFAGQMPTIQGDHAALNSRLQTCWQAGTLTPEAQAYQVRAFLIRHGIVLSSIPDLISSLTPEGPQREEALMRWEFVTVFPKTHPLVVAVAQSLQLDLDEVWWTILEIE